ncbi:hypothetical protein EJ04DRAFT_525404 [Polyplosphaeria fusca]|uniref:Uncharacterized protein n=1 Tax=Polyplosphaeria fusca TaxID=682080 RepID=A0A9P4QTG4_9PLEO|nr:hypothetical protein EJ04DRAFT_525404 [Polyplosphaeria fusca]
MQFPRRAKGIRMPLLGAACLPQAIAPSAVAAGSRASHAVSGHHFLLLLMLLLLMLLLLAARTCTRDMCVSLASLHPRLPPRTAHGARRNALPPTARTAHTSSIAMHGEVVCILSLAAAAAAAACFCLQSDRQTGGAGGGLAHTSPGYAAQPAAVAISSRVCLSQAGSPSHRLPATACQSNGAVLRLNMPAPRVRERRRAAPIR